MATKTKSKWGGITKEELAKNNKRKLVGIVKIVTGEKKAKLTLIETAGYTATEFDNGTDEKTVLLSDLPKVPKILPNDKSGKEFRVRMNEDGDEVEAFTPVRGHFSAKLVDIGPHKEGEAPYPKEKVFHEGQKDEERHLEFFAVYEITSGLFKGVQLPAYWMHYKFDQDPSNEEYTRYAFNTENPKATRGHQLRAWMQVHGLEDDLVPWDDDTILPVLLERALENDVEVEVNIANGYILREGGVMPSDGYAEANFGEDESVDEEEDEVDVEFPKKPSKKAPVKEEAKKPVAKKIAKKKADEDEDL